MKSILILFIIINNTIIQCVQDCTSNDINYPENRLRKAIPVIGAVSSGKSYFLNSLLGLDDLLQTGEGGISNFVCIIRHNPKLNNPIFFHLNFISNDAHINEINYTKEDIIEGEENIKNKIKEINESVKDKIQYGKLFYMLEINIKAIKNEKLLQNYDFYDIPGFNKVGDDHLKNFIKFFVSKIDFGIILINAETHHTMDTNNVIIKLSDAIKPRIIENYLIILNKIDRQANPEEAIEKTKEYLGTQLFDIFKMYFNTLIPLDTRKLRHINLMKENFIEYFLYLLEDYIKEYVTPFKDMSKEELNKEKRKNYEFYSLYQYLQDFINEVYEGKLISLINEFDSKNYKLEKENIFSILKEKKQYENPNLDYEIDEEDEGGSFNIIKALYIIFKKPELEKPKYNEIENYFTRTLEKVEQQEEVIKIENKKEELLKQFDIIKESFQKYEDFENQKLKEIKNNESYIKYLSEEFKELYNIKSFIYNKNMHYIGIFGKTSVGKSLILNNILGENFLTINENECTRRGFIIEDGKSIEIFTVNYEIKSLKEKKIIIFNKGDKLASGKENVTDLIKILNKKYAANTRLKTYDFFIITVPILFFEKYGFDSSLRKQIRFIDLPGLFSNGETVFDYDSILGTISCFLMVYMVDDISTDSGLENYRIFQKLKTKKLIADDNSFLELCLFIINLKSKNQNIDLAKKQILTTFLGPNNANLNPTVTIFNAKSFENFLNTKKLFSDLDYLFKYINDKYNKSRVGGEKKRFFYNTIKKIFENSFILNSKDQKCSEDISIKIKQYFYNENINDSQLQKFEKQLQKICEYLTYARNNLNNSNDYIYSFADTFFNDLKEKINLSFLKKQDYSEQIYKTLYNINNYLNINRKNGLEKNIKNYFEKNIQSYKEETNEIFNNFKCKDEFNNFEKETDQFFTKKKEQQNIKKLLEDNNNNLEKAINDLLKEFNAKTKVFQEEFNKKIEKFNKDIIILYDKYNKILNYREESQQNKIKFQSAELKDATFENTNYGTILSGIGFSGSLGGIGYAGYTIYTGVKLAEITTLTLMSGVASVIGVFTFGYFLYKNVFGNTNEEKLKQSIDKINNFIKDQINNQEHLICENIKIIETKFRAEQNFQIGIKNMQLSDKLSEEAASLFEKIKEEFKILIEKLKDIQFLKNILVINY